VPVTRNIVKSVNLERIPATCGHGESLYVDLTFLWAGIATHFMLDDPGTESRWGLRFSSPCQAGLGAHSASCTVCLSGNIADRVWRWLSTQFSAEVKEGVGTYLYSSSGSSWHILRWTFLHRSKYERNRNT